MGNSQKMKNLSFQQDVDLSPQIGYLHTMICNVSTIASTMMMPLSIRKAEPLGM